MADLELRSTPRPQVFAKEKIVEDEIIVNFNGVIRLKHELPELFAADKFLQIGDQLYIELVDPILVAINHSCDPNSALIIDADQLFLAALRNIAPGEEVTYDYSLSMCNDDYEFDCTCGATICRKKIKEFRFLPDSVQDRYRLLGVVPKYVLDRIRFLKSS